MAAEHRFGFVYTGGGPGVIPDEATHVTIHESIKVISAELFQRHPNIIQLVCHNGVVIIEERAFHNCPRPSETSSYPRRKKCWKRFFLSL